MAWYMPASDGTVPAHLEGPFATTVLWNELVIKATASGQDAMRLMLSSARKKSHSSRSALAMSPLSPNLEGSAQVGVQSVDGTSRAGHTRCDCVQSIRTWVGSSTEAAMISRGTSWRKIMSLRSATSTSLKRHCYAASVIAPITLGMVSMPKPTTHASSSTALQYYSKVTRLMNATRFRVQLCESASANCGP